MPVLKRPDRSSDRQRSRGGRQIAVALFTEPVVHFRQHDGPAVIEVAGGARRRKSLIGFVRRRVVAGEAALISHVRAKRPRFRHVAPLAAPAEHLVRERKRSAAVGRARAGGRHAADEQQHNDGRGDREDQPPAPERRQALEVVHVDAPGERLRRSRANARSAMSPS